MTEWRDVPGFEGRYQVSDDGRVLSLPRKGARGRMLKMAWRKGGYRTVGLSMSGVARTRLVHHLVLLAFVGPKPADAVTRHLDGDPTNNALSNIVYGTHTENMRDALRHGRHVNLNKTHCPQGHPYAGDNLYIDRTGGRECRICRRAHMARWAAKAKARAS